MKLGRIKPSAEHLARAPHLKKYLTAPLPTAPPEFDGTPGAAIGMWGNDAYGDCTFAALANYRAICAAREGRTVPATNDDAVVRAYLGYTGGKDEGAMETEVLNVAVKGVELGGDPWLLAAWVRVDLADVAMCKSLIAIFWSLYLGAGLPISAQSQDVWDVVSGPDADPWSWGGHAFLWSRYTPQFDGYVTWGDVRIATPAWRRKYVDEAYCLLDAERAQMIGVDWAALSADLVLAAWP